MGSEDLRTEVRDRGRYEPLGSEKLDCLYRLFLGMFRHVVLMFNSRRLR